MCVCCVCDVYVCIEVCLHVVCKYVNLHGMCAYVCGKFVCGVCTLAIWDVGLRCAFVGGRLVCVFVLGCAYVCYMCIFVTRV